MILRIGVVFLWVANQLPAQPTKCAAVEGEQLQARHMAVFLPAFRGLPPDTAISPAPVPGARRTFREPELRAIARRHSLTLAEIPENICFEWELQPLDRSAVIEAMRAALPLPDLRIQIAELSLFPGPRGTIEFRREGLGTPANPFSATPVIWRGNVVYGEGRRFSIWARVVVTANVMRVVTVQPLKRGAVIEMAQLRREMVDAFPAIGDFAQSLEQVAGKAARRDIPSDSVVRLSSLMQLPDVVRGDMVDVEVRAGAARLALTAKAESAGRNGETISVRNLSSNRLFTARVSGKGRAVVEMESKHGN